MAPLETSAPCQRPLRYQNQTNEPHTVAENYEKARADYDRNSFLVPFSDSMARAGEEWVPLMITGKIVDGVPAHGKRKNPASFVSRLLKERGTPGQPPCSL